MPSGRWKPETTPSAVSFASRLPESTSMLGAADALGLGDEVGAVLGVAAGGGRHHPDAAHAAWCRTARGSAGAPPSALSTASAAAAVVCTSRPRPASTFSLKIGVGLRVRPS